MINAKLVGFLAPFFLGVFVLLPSLVPNINVETYTESIEKDSFQLKDKQNSHERLSIDKLLGPEDNFPFLPDNHRDSGTGKFSAFN